MIATYLKMAIDVTQTAPAELGQLWNDGLNAKASVMDQRMQNRLGTEEKFMNVLADRAEQDYRPYPNDAYISKHGLTKDLITNKQASNLKRAFQKFQDNWSFMFVDNAAKFKERVTRAANRFLKGIAARTLPMTGYKVEGRGPAPIAGFWLTGEEKIIRELRSGDTSHGGPYRICQIEMRTALRAALTSRLIQTGAFVLRSELSDTVIALCNTQINHLVQSMIDPGLGLTPFAPGGLSHVDFKKENDQLFLEIQVDQI